MNNNVDSSNYNCVLVFADSSKFHPKKERFETAMKKVLELVPGVQIAVRSRDGNVWLGSQGYADIHNNVLLENCTKTLVGSVSKIHTALIIMQLQDEGILSINDPIKTWLSAEMTAEIENAKEATIKNLLNHTSGIADYLDVEHWVNALNTPNLKLSPSEKIEYIYGNKAEFSVGDKHQYSNSNFLLLGLIIEKATGMTLEMAEKKYITQPLDLQNTVAGTTQNPIPADAARHYLAKSNNGNYVEISTFSVSIGASGDVHIITNMQESLIFIESIFDKTLISESALEMMLKEEYPDEKALLFGQNISYGLGLRKVNNKYGLAVGHSGSISAYWSHLYHFPNDNVTIAVAFNGNTKNKPDYDKLLGLVTELVDIAFE